MAGRALPSTACAATLCPARLAVEWLAKIRAPIVITACSRAVIELGWEKTMEGGLGGLREPGHNRIGWLAGTDGNR